MILDLFGGPGGWKEALKILGYDHVLGFEIDPWANATARAAGHTSVECDLAKVNVWDLAHPWPNDTNIHGLVASPPCQGFSVAGGLAGYGDTPFILEAIERLRAGITSADQVLTWLRQQCADQRSPLVLEPLRWTYDWEPEWVAWEQVVTVLPLWEACAAALELWGYNTWTGVVAAEEYGVPQARRRAVLLASRTVTDPMPAARHVRFTKARTPKPASRRLKPYLTMADSLGWGLATRPSMTVTGGGSNTGGGEPFGNRARQGMVKAHQAGLWKGDLRTRVTPEEAAHLQTFRADYPWQGNQRQRYQQIGNAVPPLMGAHLLKGLVERRVIL